MSKKLGKPPPASASAQDEGREELFASCSFADLGLHPTLCAHLQDKMGFQTPTRIQAQAIPVAMSGQHMLVKAATGTGKTLAYLAPIVHLLQMREPRVDRTHGTFALVLVPTRELCLQVYGIAQQLVHRFHWIVPGYVMGGENRAKEKARLRKGISILIATPGRLLDHLQHTASFVYSNLRWIVFDEADSILELGFGKAVEDILEHLGSRNGAPDQNKNKGEHIRRQNLLLSATLNEKVNRLAKISLKNPVMIGLDDQKKPSGKSNRLGNSHTSLLSDDEEDGILEKRNDTLEHADAVDDFKLPAQLVQRYVKVSCGSRLAVLLTILKSLFERQISQKVVIFLSTCDSVDFHHTVLSQLEWSSGPQLDTDKKQKFLSCKVFRLHGNMEQVDRKKSFLGFGSEKSAILVSTDIAARGLDFPKVKYIIQYDSPGEASEYVHRVGRTARIGEKGEALLFLQPIELDYLKDLESHGVSLTEYPFQKVLDSFPVNGQKPHKRKMVSLDMHPWIMSLQRSLEGFVAAEANKRRPNKGGNHLKKSSPPSQPYYWPLPPPIAHPAASVPHAAVGKTRTRGARPGVAAVARPPLLTGRRLQGFRQGTQQDSSSMSRPMSNLGRSNSMLAARGRGSRAVSMPPDNHLGLGTILPQPQPAQSSIKDSSSGSITVNQDQANPVALSNEEIIALEDDDAEAEGEEVCALTGKRKKRCTSAVWQHFTKKIETVEVDGKTYEQLWGYCNFPKCKQRYRAESTNGTNAFRSHLRTAHKMVKGQLQLKSEKDRGKDVTNIQPFKYDLDTTINKFYLAIIMHEYPFNIVEHEYLVDALKSMRPNFAFKSRVTVRKDILDIYAQEKDKLYAELKKVPCRFSATMDVWTSCQNKSYMCVTLHWIDDAWKIQKRIVALFHLEGRHTGHRLAEALTEVFVKWDVEKKIFACTLDNASNNLVAVTDIIEDLKLNGNGSFVCDGIFFHIRCACHILNLVARDGMAVISKALEKIKALVLIVKGSPLQWEELMKCATQCGLDTSKGIQLDVSTRWNSTYMMLRDALYYKPAFIRLKIANRRKYEKISPSDSDWGMAATVFQCLEIFYDLTELLSGTSYPTANLFYRGFCELRELLSEWQNHKNLTIKQMAIAMSEKFEKYWGCSSTSLAVACFFDPRYKKKIIEFYTKKFAGDYYQVLVEEFVTTVKKLYQFYSASKPASSRTSVVVDAPTKTFSARRNSELEIYLYDDGGSDGNELNELDLYMAEPLLKQDSFDILAYWKNKTDKYPILSQIARDLMSIQVSTVASESAFSSAGRVVDPFRNRLDPEMVEALVCSKDWIHARTKDRKSIPSIVVDFTPEDTTDDVVIDDSESDPDEMDDAGEL